MISHPARRRRGAVLLAATVAAAGVVLAPASAALADVAGEYETWGYTYPVANGRTVQDTTASGGAAVAIWGTGTSNDLTFDVPATTTAFRIRARRTACGPDAARMSVQVNQVTVGQFDVAATSWTDYTITGSWPGQYPTLRVELLNAYTDTCRRELVLDRATAVPATTPTGPKTYYVDPAGNPANNGTSPSTPWRSVSDVNGHTLLAGETVLFKRGATFGNAHLIANTAGVTYGAYGDGSVKPILDGGGGATHTVDVSGASVVVQDLQVQNGGYDDKIGISVTAADVLVQRVTATGNAIGVQADTGANRLRVTNSILRDNKTVIEPPGDTGDDDFGACGVSVLAADHVEIDHNTFNGNVGTSTDFGQDGSAVELYGGTNTSVHHNTASDNHTFSELGNDGTNNTRFYDNVITTTASGPVDAYGFNVQGDDGRFGGVDNTVITNNTIVMLSSNAGPLSTGPDPGVVRFHSNIVQAINAGYNEQAIDEGHNVYFGYTYSGIKSLSSAGHNAPAPSSKTANPKFETGGYKLQAGSPALNINADTYGVTTDRDDQPRKVGTAVDAGAYERQ